MKTTTATHFDRHYQTHLKHLKLKGLQPKIGGGMPVPIVTQGVL